MFSTLVAVLIVHIAKVDGIWKIISRNNPLISGFECSNIIIYCLCVCVCACEMNCMQMQIVIFTSFNRNSFDKLDGHLCVSVEEENATSNAISDLKLPAIEIGNSVQSFASSQIN